MKYKISGHRIDIGEALPRHVKAALNDVFEKYGMNPTTANIIFSRDRHEFICEITVHLSTGLNVQAHAATSDFYGAADNAAEKIEKQLRRYKRRLKNHHRERQEPVELQAGSTYIVSSKEETDEEQTDALQPVIIAEMETKIPKISVGEAVMQMELANKNVLVFQNERSKTINVVYRRDDGNIGWIEPQ